MSVPEVIDTACSERAQCAVSHLYASVTVYADEPAQVPGEQVDLLHAPSPDRSLPTEAIVYAVRAAWRHARQ